MHALISMCSVVFLQMHWDFDMYIRNRVDTSPTVVPWATMCKQLLGFVGFMLFMFYVGDQFKSYQPVVSAVEIIQPYICWYPNEADLCDMYTFLLTSAPSSVDDLLNTPKEAFSHCVFVSSIGFYFILLVVLLLLLTTCKYCHFPSSRHPSNSPSTTCTWRKVAALMWNLTKSRIMKFNI